MIGEYVSIYETDCHTGTKQLVLTAPSKDEAEWAFDELRRKLPRYSNRQIAWQSTFFNDEIMVGEIS